MIRIYIRNYPYTIGLERETLKTLYTSLGAVPAISAGDLQILLESTRLRLLTKHGALTPRNHNIECNVHLEQPCTELERRNIARALYFFFYTQRSASGLSIKFFDFSKEGLTIASGYLDDHEIDHSLTLDTVAPVIDADFLNARFYDMELPTPVALSLDRASIQTPQQLFDFISQNKGYGNAPHRIGVGRWQLLIDLFAKHGYVLTPYNDL